MNGSHIWLGHKPFRKLVCMKPGSLQPTVLAGGPVYMFHESDYSFIFIFYQIGGDQIKTSLSCLAWSIQHRALITNRFKAKPCIGLINIHKARDSFIYTLKNHGQ